MDNASTAPNSSQEAGSPRSGARPSPRHKGIPPSWARLGGALAVLAVVFLGGWCLFQAPGTNGLAKETPDAAAKFVNGVPFKSWPRDPDLALVFSGQAMGYLQPCGCSSPQYGGLARRFNFIQSLRDKGWKVVPVDVGDVSQTQGSQAILKYRTAMRSLEVMGYGAVGLGKNEFLMPLSVALGQHTLDRPRPRVVATNLANTEPGGLWHRMNVRQTEVVEIGVFKVGVVSIVGPTVAKQVASLLPEADKMEVDFLHPDKALPQGLKELKDKKANICVLLFQGSDDEASQYVASAYALYRAGQAPLLHAAVCLDTFSDPRGLPTQVDKIPTQIITLGHKGKNVGVLGMFRNPKNLEMRYQLVPIGPEFNPKTGDEKKNPVLGVMQEYADELKLKDYLSPRLSPRSVHPTQVHNPDAFYVGSKRCMDCHEHAGEVWSKSHHAQAYKTLEKEVFPTGRQYDPECIMCHTVGFEFKTGFADPRKKGGLKALAEHNMKLRDVGCESCHGPCSDHVSNVNDDKLYPLINPWRPTVELNPKATDAEKDAAFKRRMNLVDWNLCQKCHDTENDVNWSDVGFDTKYITRGIIHNTPGGRGDTAMKAAAARMGKGKK